MPHSHVSTDAHTKRIEACIDQLLLRGQQITKQMTKEMQLRGRRVQSHQRLPCSRSVSYSSATVHTTSTANRTPKEERISSCARPHSRSSSSSSESRQLIRMVSNKKNSSLPEKAKTSSSSKISISAKLKNKVVISMSDSDLGDGEEKQEATKKTQKCVEMRSFSVEKVVLAAEKAEKEEKKEEKGGWKQLLVHEMEKEAGKEKFRVKTVLFVPLTASDGRWIRVNQQWFEVSTGRRLVNLWTDVYKSLTKNVWLNGRLIKM